MGWYPNRAGHAERQKHRELMPLGVPTGTFAIHGPARYKAILETEAYRRDIPVSWLALEMFALGLEAYKLVNDIPEGAMAGLEVDL